MTLDLFAPKKHAPTLHHGDCLAVLKTLDDASVDAVVTDPPYLIDFMGKGWDSADGIAGKPEVWTECLRVLKPGGHLLAFGATRTYHRMACAIEDAGFEIRDSIHWMYGSGFPKGLRPVPHMWQSARLCLAKENVPHVVQISPSIRLKSRGEKEPTALALAVIQPVGALATLTETGEAGGSSEVTVTLLSESEAQQVVIDWSTISSWKGLSDDAFDVVNTSITETESNTTIVRKILNSSIGVNTPSSIRHNAILPNGSKWPACDAASFFPEEKQSLSLIPTFTVLATATENPARKWEGWNVALKPSHEPVVVARKPLAGTVAANVERYGTGALNIDASRVQYADAADMDQARVPQPTLRPNGIDSGHALGATAGRNGETFDPSKGRWPPNTVLSHTEDCTESACDETCAVAELDRQGDSPSRFFPVFRYQAKPSRSERGEGNVHPTVKPIALMEWLVTLVTPPDGVVLDPFMGSGTTGVAAVRKGFRFVGIEREDEYLAIARARIEAA